MGASCALAVECGIGDFLVWHFYCADECQKNNESSGDATEHNGCFLSQKHTPLFSHARVSSGTSSLVFPSRSSTTPLDFLFSSPVDPLSND